MILEQLDSFSGNKPERFGGDFNALITMAIVTAHATIQNMSKGNWMT